MAPIPLTRWAWLALFAAKAYADCSCAGLDYTNGGSYLIDGSVDADFSFNSVFDGMQMCCCDHHVSVLLMRPAN